MTGFRTRITNVRIKDGKVIKTAPRMDASKAIRQRKSKKIRPVRRTAG